MLLSNFKVVFLIVFTLFNYSLSLGQILTESQIKEVADKINNQARGVTLSNGVEFISCNALGRTMYYVYSLPDLTYFENDFDIDEIIENLIVQGTAELNIKNKIDIEFYYYFGSRLVKKISIPYTEFEKRLTNSLSKQLQSNDSRNNSHPLKENINFKGLKEFDVRVIEKRDNKIVQGNRDFPDNALILVYSNLDNLDFRSSLGGINRIKYNKELNRYEILINPSKQIIFVLSAGYIEKRIALINPSPKEVFSYEVSESLKEPTYILENADHTGGEFVEVINHPKSNGVDFKIKVYNGWEIKDGDLPSITKQLKYDRSTFMISIVKHDEFKLFSEVFRTESETVQNLVAEEFINSLGINDILESKITTLNMMPCLQLKYMLEADHLNVKMKLYFFSWVIFLNDKLVFLQFVRPNQKEFEILDLVALKIASSFFILN